MALAEHYFPSNYNEAYIQDHGLRSIYDFLALLQGKCAAFITQQMPEGPYMVRFNTYNFEQLIATKGELTIGQKFRFKVEHRMREKYCADPDIIVGENNYFMIIYMHSVDGYRVYAQRLNDGNYEFMVETSPNYKKRIAS